MPFGALLALVGVEVTAANLANTYLLTSALVPLFGSALTASGRIVRCKTGPARCHFIEGINDVPMIQNVTIPQTTTPVERSPMRIEHRQVGPCNVPQYNFDMCHNDLKKVIIHTSIPSAGVAQFDNIPSTCMVLSTVLFGGCGIDPPYPLVCGSACLQYSGLSDYAMEKLGDWLGNYAA